MSTNRYTQLSWGTLNDIPLLKLPIEALAGVMAVAEKEKEDFDKLSSLTPKYIKDSKSDVELANKIKGYQNQLTNDLSEIAAKGNANEYRRSLHDAKKQIADMWAEGGAANALETRYGTWAEMQKQIDKDFENNRRVGNYVKSSYKFGDIEYDPSMRTYKGLSSANYYRDIKDEDVSKWFTENIASVKKTLLDSGMSKDKVDKINTIRDYFQVKGVTHEKLMEVFQSVMPQDFKNSIYQKARAEKFYNPNLPDPSQYMYQVEKDEEGNAKVDENGKPVYKERTVLNAKGKPIIDNSTGKPITELIPDLSNPLMRLYHGYSVAGSYKEIDHDRLVLKDFVELERQKFLLKKEFEAPEYIPREQAVTNNANAPAPLELKLDANGNLLTGEATAYKASSNPLAGGTVAVTPKTKTDKDGKPIKAIDLFRSGELARTFPEAADAYNHYKDDPWFKKLPDKEKAEVLVTAVNNARSGKAVGTITVNQVVDNKEGVVFKKGKTESIVGKEGSLGSIATRPIFLIDENNNVISDAKTSEDIIRDYFGGDVAAFTKATQFSGDLRGDNSVIPSGDVLTTNFNKEGGWFGIGAKSGKVRLLVATDSHAQAAIRAPIFIGNSAANGNNKDSPPFRTGLASVDSAYPKGIQVTDRVFFRDVDLREQAKEIKEQFKKDGYYIEPVTNNRITNPNAVDAIVNGIISEAERVKKTPSENTVRHELWVKDPRTGEYIGTEKYWRDIVASLESQAAALEFGK